MGQRKILYSIPELCTGCHMCELMCALTKTGTISPYLARIRVSYRQGEDYACVPVLCRHCHPAPCQQACPVPEAMTRDEALGVVAINQSDCIHCLACVQACPFGAIQVSPDKQVLKCDLCGGDPVCVRQCPPRPENSLPHLPWPKQSCLQYIEPQRVNTNKLISARAKGQPVQLPNAHLKKVYPAAPQPSQQIGKSEET